MPTTRRSEAGRAQIVLVLAALAAILALVFVVFDPLGSGDDLGRENGDYEAPDLREEGATPGEGPGFENGSGGLVGRYGEGDLGAVRLRLLRVNDLAPMADQPLELAARTGGSVKVASGADGVAVFPKVVPGRGYRLEIAGTGYAHVTVHGIRVMRAQTTDLGDILLGANVVLRGRVINGSGRPLRDTAVAVYTPNRGILAEGIIVNMVGQATRLPDPVEKVLTDEDGWFTFVSLSPGSYRLEARLGGYATRYQDDVVVSEKRPARDMTIVLGEGATVRGEVLDQDGKPVTGARVIAMKDAGRRFTGSMTLERDIAHTDSAGRYTLDTLTMGTSYRFGVLADDYAPIFEMGSTALQEKIQEKDFTLVLGGSITGRVTRKDNGEPVQDARVVVAVGNMMGMRPGSGSKEKMGTGQARTDETGTFRITSLLPGPVMSAQIRASGFVTHTASMFTGNGWADVEPGSVQEVTIELEPGGSIGGVITDKVTGEPIAQAEVMIVPRGSLWAVFFTGSPQTTAGPDGSFLLTGVTPGEYGIVAVAPGFAASDPSADGTLVTVAAAGGLATQNVALLAAGHVTGIVRDSQGEPVAGATVRTRQAPEAGGDGNRGGRRGGRRGPGGISSMLPGGSGADLTDQDGRFIIEDVSSDRRWILRVKAEEYVDGESAPFKVVAGETKEVNVELSGGGQLEGRVVDDHGQFVPGARVRIGHIPADRAGQSRMRAWEVDRYLEQRVHFTDDEGRFRAENLTPGMTVVKVEREGYITFYKRNVVIRADETYENYNVAMSKGDVMEGTVRGADGRPLEGAFVAVTTTMPGEEPEEEEEADEDIEPSLSARSDQDGRFVIENIPPGVYNVVIWFAPGHKGWGRDRDESGIRRGISSSSTTVLFRLVASEPGAGFPGGGGGR